MIESNGPGLPTTAAEGVEGANLPHAVTEHADGVADAFSLASLVLGLLVATCLLAALLILLSSRDPRPLYVLGG